MEKLTELDTAFFFLINGAHSPFFDQFFYLISNKFIWIPFYALLLYFTFKTYKKQFWIIAIGAVLCVGSADFISTKGFKNNIQRYRPTHNEIIKDQVHTVNNYKGGKYGFVSSHASNVFAIAVFFFIYLKRYYKYLGFTLFFWAVLVSYSRIYLGVHYPFDILGGMVLGGVLGALFAIFVLIQLKKRA